MTRRSSQLTPRQRDVVALLDAGLSCPQIARRLGISLKTVRYHYRAVAKGLRGDTNQSDVAALRLVRRHAAELLEGKAA